MSYYSRWYAVPKQSNNHLLERTERHYVSFTQLVTSALPESAPRVVAEARIGAAPRAVSRGAPKRVRTGRSSVALAGGHRRAYQIVQTRRSSAGLAGSCLQGNA